MAVGVAADIYGEAASFALPWNGIPSSYIASLNVLTLSYWSTFQNRGFTPHLRGRGMQNYTSCFEQRTKKKELGRKFPRLSFVSTTTRATVVMQDGRKKSEAPYLAVIFGAPLL